jgi:hypothetical protein
MVQPEMVDENIMRRIALFLLDNCGYRHTCRIFNTYCFSTATIVTPARLILRYRHSSCFFNDVGYRSHGVTYVGLHLLKAVVFDLVYEVLHITP